MAACTHFGLSIVPYAPLHGGLLADLSVLDREIAGGKRYGGPGFSDDEIAVARELDRLARDWGLGMQQVSLAWLLSRPAVASVIVGAETVEEMRANVSAADVDLTSEQLEAVSALTAHLRPTWRERALSHVGHKTLRRSTAARPYSMEAAVEQRHSASLAIASTRERKTPGNPAITTGRRRRSRVLHGCRVRGLTGRSVGDATDEARQNVQPDHR